MRSAQIGASRLWYTRAIIESNGSTDRRIDRSLVKLLRYKKKRKEEEEKKKQQQRQLELPRSTGCLAACSFAVRGGAARISARSPGNGSAPAFSSSTRTSGIPRGANERTAICRCAIHRALILRQERSRFIDSARSWARSWLAATVTTTITTTITVAAARK